MAEKKIKHARAYLICDKRRKKVNGTCPIRLIVNYNGKQKVWGLDRDLSKADFNLTRKQFIGGNIDDDKRKELQKAKEELDEKIKKARDIINDMPVFTFENFERKMFGANRETLFTALEGKIKDMILEGRAGNATTYECTLRAFRMYRGGEKIRNGRKVNVIGGRDLLLTEVDVYLLKDFEKWFLDKGNSKTTVGIYMRNIQVILYDSIREGTMDAKYLPFGKNKYVIPNATKRKLALMLKDIGDIEKLTLSDSRFAEKYRDYWLFSYYTGGMNVKDISRLKYKNITIDEISYVRAKTALKKRENEEPITAPLMVVAARIIDKWGNKPANPESYVFPILKPGMTPMQERQAVVAVTTAINKHMKRIADVLGIQVKVSSYTARHSFATILKRSGVPVDAISEALGHSETKVTQHYLDSFEKDAKRKMWANLDPDRLKKG